MASSKKQPEQPIDPVSACRLRLLMHHSADFVFFGHLAMRLELVPSPNLPRAIIVDGQKLYYNPDRLIPDSPGSSLEFRLAQALLHCIMGHHVRRGYRNAGKWLIACTLAVHCILRHTAVAQNQVLFLPSKFKLPDNQTAEFYYDALPDDNPMVMQLQNIQSLVTDEEIQQVAQQFAVIVRDLPSESRDEHVPLAPFSEAEWKLAACRAQQYAKQRGTLPGDLSSLIENPIQVPVDYESLLAEFMLQNVGPDNADWSRPSRRSHSYGIYLPSHRSTGMRLVVIFVDTSGSMSEDCELRHCAGQIDALLSFCNCEAYIVQHDADIQKVIHWKPEDGPLTDYVFCGRGGTSHVPAWKWLKESQLDPDVVIAISDGYTEWGEDPKVPVLWIFTPRATFEKPPFGRVIRLPAKERER